MSNRLKLVVEKIRSSFENQFLMELGNAEFAKILDKELQRKKEAFVQIQLSNFGMSFDELVELRHQLGLATISGRMNKASSQISNMEAGIPLRKLDELVGTEEDEADYKPSRRRRGQETKTYKTTPKQRAYQKNYYKRKKALELQEQENNGVSGQSGPATSPTQFSQLPMNFGDDDFEEKVAEQVVADLIKPGIQRNGFQPKIKLRKGVKSTEVEA